MRRSHQRASSPRAGGGSIRLVRRALALALALAGCAAPTETATPIHEQYALSRLSLDPLTELGALVTDSARGESLNAQFGIVFEIANCDGTGPVIVDLDTTAPSDTGAGTIAVLIGEPQDGDPCAGTGRFTAQPSSFGPDGLPLVRGPLDVEGLTAEGHVPLSRINRALLGFLPVWWSVTARRRQGSTALGDAEARTVWRPAHLAVTASPELEGLSLLDQLIGADVQPDLDEDRDGLERFVDTDGDGAVDRCVDGDGEAVDGPECVSDPRFVDGYELVLRFRLVPAELVTN